MNTFFKKLRWEVRFWLAIFVLQLVLIWWCYPSAKEIVPIQVVSGTLKVIPGKMMTPHILLQLQIIFSIAAPVLRAIGAVAAFVS